MNARERAYDIVGRHALLLAKDAPQMIDDIEQAITAAEEAKAREEREACMKIIEAEAELCSKGKDGILKSGYIALHDSWQAIRARSEGEQQQKGD